MLKRLIIPILVGVTCSFAQIPTATAEPPRIGDRGAPNIPVFICDTEKHTRMMVEKVRAKVPIDLSTTLLYLTAILDESGNRACSYGRMIESVTLEVKDLGFIYTPFDTQSLAWHVWIVHVANNEGEQWLMYAEAIKIVST